MNIIVNVKTNRFFEEYKCMSVDDVTKVITHCLRLNVYNLYGFKQIEGMDCRYIKRIFIYDQEISLPLPERFEIKSFEIFPYFDRYKTKLGHIIRRAAEQIIERARLNEEELTVQKLADDKFINRTTIVLEKGATIFSDSEVKDLLHRITTPFRRKLLLNFQQYKGELHQIAMKCYEKYWGAVISFLLNLPIAEFAQKTLDLVNNNEKDHGEIPALQLKVRGRNNEDFFLCFYTPIARKGSTKLVASLFKKSRKENIKVAVLTEQAYMEYRIRTDKSNLELLINNLDNPGAIYCGVKEGQCICCNRPLIDPRYRLLGYGETCANKLGIQF